MIKFISKRLEEISDFPGVVDEEEIDEEEIEEIKRWTESRFENASRVTKESILPDILSYGDSISIKGVDDSEIILCIDEIFINPSGGEEEWIDISLLNGQEKIASGSIKLTVGYLNYDEDGGIADGIEDSIDYYYNEIIEEMDSFILEQIKQVEIETEIIRIIEKALE